MTAAWEEISRYVGIRVQPQAYPAAGESNKSRDLDKYTEDPTAALSVQQASDYLKGIMWGNGDGVISIEPTDDILEFASKEELDPWYKFDEADSDADEPSECRFEFGS